MYEKGLDVVRESVRILMRLFVSNMISAIGNLPEFGMRMTYYVA